MIEGSAGNPENAKVKPWSRVAILLFFLVFALALCRYLTGSFLPSDPKQSLIFQGSLLLIVLGSAVLEHKFTKPADSAVNALMGMVTLIPVHRATPNLVWWLVLSYCAVVFFLAVVCVAVSSGPHISDKQQIVAHVTYRPAVVLGSARVLYSILFLFGLFTFYELRSTGAVLLLIFWGLFVVVWPLSLPELLSGISRNKRGPKSIGRILRTDAPNIVRVSLDPTADWSPSRGKIYQQADGKQTLVIPLFSQVQDEGLLGTGLCVESPTDRISGLSRGQVYEIADRFRLSESEIAQKLSGDATSRLIGFVIEDSSIGTIKFETIDSDSCQEGMVAWCRIGKERVFYQITNGLTREESLQTDKHGFHIAVAAQLGRLENVKGFSKFEWLPAMNTPVFATSEEFGVQLKIGKDGDFLYGLVPRTAIKVVGPLMDVIDSHTAILGVTGSGKTELAFDIIRKATEAGIKVVCIDLTSQYAGRLANLNPSNLSISAQLSKELGQKLMDVETGQYNAGAEKKALKTFSDKLRADVSETVQGFLTDKSELSRIGLIQLEEISNTQATLYITELFMSCLLHFAKENAECAKILIVVEEAHTVMPEPSTMGLGDFSSRGLVAKISQIALQGRKYGVGLLVIAQRTATVSKSVLTQCNTVISFTCFDDTSLTFLKNVFGDAHTDLIPNLPPLSAVIFGKGVRSERPIIVQIPFSREKSEFSFKKPTPPAAAAIPASGPTDLSESPAHDTTAKIIAPTVPTNGGG
jgi:hypothetical protein